MKSSSGKNTVVSLSAQDMYFFVHTPYLQIVRHGCLFNEVAQRLIKKFVTVGVISHLNIDYRRLEFWLVRSSIVQ